MAHSGLSANWRKHTCIDRVVPPSLLHPSAAAAHAFEVSEARRAMSAAPSGTLDANAVVRFKMAVILSKKWHRGQTLNCRFLDGSATQKRRVEEKAHIWEQHANIKLKFIKQGAAEIRISFMADPGSWSALGQDALIQEYFPLHQPTMNFGWLADDTEDPEYERVVVHEFGHALGCIHEHQSPNENLQWNADAVYEAFSGPPNNWSKEEIDSNILQKYSPAGIEATAFDKASIMLYQFDASLFKNNVGTPNNTRLSEKDKAFIATMYPKP